MLGQLFNHKKWQKASFTNDLLQKSRPTKRAGDLGYAPRYFGFFRVFGLFSVSRATPPSHPKSPNASRWALNIPSKIRVTHD
jgi:hypothetical protein